MRASITVGTTQVLGQLIIATTRRLKLAGCRASRRHRAGPPWEYERQGGNVAGYMFDWARCGRERFEAIVESLLVNKHVTEHTGHAQAVDGRGGDGGIDVDVTLDDGTLDTIYQLKYFPEGLSGNYK